jgi:hypothetical protein
MKETRDRKSRNPEGIETVHLRDRCRKSGASRHIANREIGVPKVKRNRTSEVPKSRHNRDRPSERTRGRDWCHRRKARQEVVHRLIGNRDIGDPGHKGFVHFEIAIREIPMSGVQLSAQQRRRTEA